MMDDSKDRVTEKVDLAPLQGNNLATWGIKVRS